MPSGRRGTLVVAEGRIGKALHDKRWPLNASLGYLAGLGVPAVPEVSRLGLSAAATSTFFTRVEAGPRRGQGPQIAMTMSPRYSPPKQT